MKAKSMVTREKTNQSQQQRSQFIMLFFAFSFGMILSNLLGQVQQPEREAGEPILMTYRGMDKTVGDLPEPLLSKLKAMREDSRSEQTELLYSVALQWELQTLAARKEISLEEAGQELFDLTPPSEEEINAFYQANAEKLGKPFFEVRDSIMKYLSTQKARQVRQSKISELLSRGDLAIFLDT